MRLLPRYASVADDSAATVRSGTLTSPMPGTVLAVKVTPGDRVREGQPLLVVEAMKMEHVITAPHDGTITTLAVHAGQTVAIDAPLVTVQPLPAGGA
jgi:acetyl-CoA/propionyl-CoA carboxylase biotin carboxyl carrier protein